MRAESRLVEAFADAPETHVREVFEPLEIRNRDAARVGVNVGQKQDVFFQQNFFRAGGRRTVRAFGDDFRFNARRRFLP